MGKKIRVLIVDDNPLDVRLLEILFLKWGYECFIATNGQQALDTIDKEKPDLILMDVLLPDMNGLDISNNLRIKGNNTPILILSGMEDRALDKSNTSLSYMQKPYTPKDMRTRIELMIKDSKDNQASA